MNEPETAQYRDRIIYSPCSPTVLLVLTSTILAGLVAGFWIGQKTASHLIVQAGVGYCWVVSPTGEVSGYNMRSKAGGGVTIYRGEQATSSEERKNHSSLDDLIVPDPDFQKK